jgi:hypothetical protein
MEKDSSHKIETMSKSNAREIERVILPPIAKRNRRKAPEILGERAKKQVGKRKNSIYDSSHSTPGETKKMEAYLDAHDMDAYGRRKLH